MTTKDKLIKLAKQLNCRLDFDMWDITAPDNHCFAENPGCHYIVFEPDSDWTPELAMRDAYNRLSSGLLECHCGDCDPEPFNEENENGRDGL